VFDCSFMLFISEPRISDVFLISVLFLAHSTLILSKRLLMPSMLFSSSLTFDLHSVTVFSVVIILLLREVIMFFISSNFPRQFSTFCNLLSILDTSFRIIVNITEASVALSAESTIFRLSANNFDVSLKDIVSGSKLRVQDDKGFDWLEFEVKFTTHS